MIRIHEDLCIPYGAIPMRCYILKAEGDGVKDILASAVIREVDLKGTEFRSYPLIDASEPVNLRALDVICASFGDKLRQQQRLKSLEVGA